MFAQHRSRNMFEAAFTTLSLIYHVTVNNLRKGHRNALMGLVITVLQTVSMIAGFWLLFAVVGVRNSPIRGDFIVYLMTGIFMFMAHAQAIGAVAASGSPTNQMMKHGPLNTAIMIAAAAMAVLYRQTFSSVIVLTAYNYLVTPIQLDQPLWCYAMVLMAWFTGCAIGLIFLSIRPWWPQGTTVLTQFYQRINMVFSGKMFVANTMSTSLLHAFSWNPLFHIIDQTRGFAFINYSPRNSSLEYPLWCTVGLLMVGLMAEYVTRRSVSLSTLAGR